MTVGRSAEQRPQDQHVERALQHVATSIGPGFPRHARQHTRRISSGRNVNKLEPTNNGSALLGMIFVGGLGLDGWFTPLPSARRRLEPAPLPNPPAEPFALLWCHVVPSLRHAIGHAIAAALAEARVAAATAVESLPAEKDAAQRQESQRL